MPNLIIIAGPNGAGKTTAAQVLVPELFQCREFVNADAIAAGLSPFNSEGVAIAAGRLMLARIRELLARHQSFAFETTLATRSFVPLITQAKRNGYAVHLIYLWLESAALAQERVKLRVSLGGHSIDDAVIHRRYYRGLNNFFSIYCPLVSTWHFYDNSHRPELIASGSGIEKSVINEILWQKTQALWTM